MPNNNIKCELLEKKRASESQESLEISSAVVQVGEHTESEDLSVTLSNQDPILNASDTFTGQVSKLGNNGHAYVSRI